jgi:hypothetical protein
MLVGEPLCQRFDRGESGIPSGGDLVHPRRRGRERFDVHGVAAFASDTSTRNEVNALEHSKVLPYCLPGHWKLGGQRRGGGGTVDAEVFEKSATVRLGEGGEQLVGMVEQGGGRHDPPVSA